MKFHALHFNWLSDEDEFRFLIGVMLGSVGYEPEAKHLHSLRLFVLFFKVEILWKTGVSINGM